MEVSEFKRKIIPKEMKLNIDAILEEQLFNANRYYAKSNADISKLARAEMVKLPTQFLAELKRRWIWHNHFYEDLLEPAFLEITAQTNSDLSVKQILDLIEIYKTCCLVDEATLVMSGSIKDFLQYHFPKIPISLDGFDIEEAKFMLFTPAEETFFAQYYIDHLMYIILLKTDDVKAVKYKQYLINKFHAKDELIFEGRFNKDFSSKLNCSIEDLLKQIKGYTISPEYKIRHLYFELENPERKAFTDIIKYDNVDEKFISSQLIGISGFLLRKKVLDMLNSSLILPNRGYIYEFSNDIVINSLYILLNERKKIMDKDIKPYKQKGMTCAIACMLMVLEYFQLIPKADWMLERKYYRIYHSKYMEGTPFSALAWHFAKNGLDTEIIHSERDFFDNSSHTLSDTIFEDAMLEYKEFINIAIEKGAKVTNGVDINCIMLKKCIEEGKMVIIAGQYGAMLHAILVFGYNEKGFLVCDPLCGKKQVKTDQEITSFIQTPIGKWCVVVGEKKPKKAKLMTAIPEIQNEAMEKLKLNEHKICVDKDEYLIRKLEK